MVLVVSTKSVALEFVQGGQYMMISPLSLSPTVIKNDLGFSRMDEASPRSLGSAKVKINETNYRKLHIKTICFKLQIILVRGSPSSPQALGKVIVIEKGEVNNCKPALALGEL